jgi:hypothetical protein
MDKIFCDGCGDDLTGRSPALTGERTNGLAGGGMPHGTFHLCTDCGQYAFAALAKRQAAKHDADYPRSRVMTGY